MTSSRIASGAALALADKEAESLPGIELQGEFRFRQGQATFLHKLAEALRAGERNLLGVFVPGYGKTIIALSSFVVTEALGIARNLVVFVPRGNLRDQYANPRELQHLFAMIGAAPFSFCVADSQRVFLKNLQTRIIITTYQYASGAAGNAALQRYCEQADCMFVFDEVHHLSDEGTWATQIQNLPFAASVALSGTPMRSDNKTLFGVPFDMREDGEQYYRALHEVTLRDAHREGRILKRVAAHVIDYKIKLTNVDTQQQVELSLSKMMKLAKNKNELDAFLTRKKLRFHHVYLDALLRPAFEAFDAKRRHIETMRQNSRKAGRNCQMLVIAMSNMHAAAILEFIEEHFPSYVSSRIGQDIPEQERLRRLDDYRSGLSDVMVQVDMIGEGTDIKTISVIVKADLVRAYSKTMQQIFRGMRYFNDFDDEANVCDIFAADDSDLVQILEWVTNEEQFGIKLRTEQHPEGKEAPPAGVPDAQWELTNVQHHSTRSHNLELFPGFGVKGAPAPKGGKALEEPREPQTVTLLDVTAREAELRQQCADLAARLTFALRAAGQRVEVRHIHAQAKRRFGKAQEQMSIDELVRKYKWLQSCVAARRFV